MRLLRQRRGLSFILVLMLAMGITLYSIACLPDDVWLENGGEYTFDGSVNLFNSIGLPSTGKQINGTRTSESSFKLFGVVPVKKVNLTVTEPLKLIPGGYPAGIKFLTDGVMVVGMGNVETSGGLKNPAYDAGVRIKDIILKINGKKISSSSELSNLILTSNGKSVTMTIKRNNATIDIQVVPVKAAEDGKYKTGLWVRDSTAGIGTITYIDPATGRFGALGHGISDIDTGELMPLAKGSVNKALIIDVRKGISGDPGELKGIFKDEDINGRLYKNSEEGIYGVLNKDFYQDMKAIPVGFKQEINEGKAQILSCIDGEKPQYYEIEIVKAYKSSQEKTKNMLIKITDQRLLEKTGGIVQGMSGSPIIQNGKIIGAVTHVLINDPTKGYGIFIENMLKNTAEIRDAA